MDLGSFNMTSEYVTSYAEYVTSYLKNLVVTYMEVVVTYMEVSCNIFGILLYIYIIYIRIKFLNFFSFFEISFGDSISKKRDVRKINGNRGLFRIY